MRKKNKKKIISEGEHNIFTHFPIDPNCKICKECKAVRAQCRSSPEKTADALPTPTKFAQALTLDHKTLNEEIASRDHDQNICVILDRATYWLQAYPDKSKSAQATKYALQRFLGPQQKAEHVYSDNSHEIRIACEELGFSHDTSTPHRSETNGIAENAVKKVKEGSSCALAKAGMSEQWWNYAVTCF